MKVIKNGEYAGTQLWGAGVCSTTWCMPVFDCAGEHLQRFLHCDLQVIKFLLSFLVTPI